MFLHPVETKTCHPKYLVGYAAFLQHPEVRFDNFLIPSKVTSLDCFDIVEESVSFRPVGGAVCLCKCFFKWRFVFFKQGSKRICKCALYFLLWFGGTLKKGSRTDYPHFKRCYHNPPIMLKRVTCRFRTGLVITHDTVLSIQNIIHQNVKNSKNLRVDESKDKAKERLHSIAQETTLNSILCVFHVGLLK